MKKILIVIFACIYIISFSFFILTTFWNELNSVYAISDAAKYFNEQMFLLRGQMADKNDEIKVLRAEIERIKKCAPKCFKK